MKLGTMSDTKSVTMSTPNEVNLQLDMKQVIKVVLLKVANKTTSRYGVTLFLFCSSMWLLTQAFLALHNGCWISNTEILSKIKEKTAEDCKMSPKVTGIGQEEAKSGQQPAGVPDALQHLLSQETDGGAGGRAVFNVIVERGVEAAENPVDMIVSKSRSFHQKESLNAPENGREKRSEDKSPEQENEPTNDKKEMYSLFDTKVGVHTEVERQNLPNLNKQSNINIGNGTAAKHVEKQPTSRPYVKLPSGSGVPALGPVPGYTIPANISKDVIKITKESWETMGCINRVTIFAPGVNALPKDSIWQQLYQSFRKHRMGYYLLRCPENTCDIILRASSTAKSIVAGSAVLVGPSTQTMSKKTRGIMEEIKRLTPDNLLKIYLFSLDNSPMMNYYDPSMANFEYHYSMTYHSQSDVPIPYGRYRERVGAESARNWAYGKKSLVAWVEDNCDHTFWPRIEYVRELTKHIPVDMYGKCGNRNCTSPHCLEELKGYKFYLALEEAACDEFITLHFWQRALSSGAVPVVYAGKPYAYAKVAPPNSFIHIADYDSPAALAAHLHKLSASDSEYNKFQEWRTLGSVEVSGPGFSLDSLCGMVPQLIHLSPPARRVLSRGKFYRSCRKGIYVNGLAGSGDLSTWTPWR